MSVLQGTSGVTQSGDIVPAGQVASTNSEEKSAAIAEAQQKLKTAVAESVAKNRPAIVQNGESMLAECKNIMVAIERVHASLKTVFPNINLGAWSDLGSQSYFTKKQAAHNRIIAATMLSATSTKTGEIVPPTDPDRRAVASTNWSSYAPAAQLRLLPQLVLDNDKVRSYLGGVSATTSFYKGGLSRWGWVSELGSTIPTAPPDFAFVDKGGSEGIQVPDKYPFGWLTNLESALAILGYFQHAVNSDPENFVRGSQETPYKMFDQTSLDHLKRGGDIDMAINTIFDANHSNKKSWAVRGQGYLAVQPLGVSFTDDPSKLMDLILTKHTDMCEGIMSKLEIDSNVSIAYSNGTWHTAKSMEELRPYSILRYGGPLQQNVFSDDLIVDDTEVAGGLQFAPGGGLGAAPQSYKSIASKLTKDAATMTSIAGDIETNYAEYGISQEIAAELSANGILAKLSNLLKSVSAALSGNAKRVFKNSQQLKVAHRNILRTYCQELMNIKDAFNDDDAWYNLGDDWDDNLLGDVAAATDALSDLSTSFIGTGQTSVMYKEQCFLLSFISDLAAVKAQKLDSVRTEEYNSKQFKVSKRLPYAPNDYVKKSVENNASILMDGEGYGFLNKLVANQNLAAYYNILNHELSNLQPKIRLWKVIFDDDGNEREVEIKFDTNFTKTDLQLFKSTDARGVGVGLKSFNFTYDGSNPFSVKKSIKANLKIFANTFSELLRDRPSSYIDGQGKRQSETYKIVDLAMKTWNTARSENSAAEPSCAPEFDLQEENIANAELNFRLKAQIGMSAPLNQMSSMSPNLLAALNETYVTINLTPTVHNFEFDEYGRVLFNLNFLAYVEQFFDQSSFNVFGSVNTNINRYYRDLMLKHYNSSGCSAEQVNQKKDEFSANIKTEQEQAVGSLIGDMMTQDIIYYMNIPYEQIKTFLSYGPHRTYDQIAQGSQVKVFSNKAHNAHLQARINSSLEMEFAEGKEGTAIDAKNRAEIQAALIGNDPRETDLAFFYLSDLIDLVLIKIETGLKDTQGQLDRLTSMPGGSVITCNQVAAKKKELEIALKSMKKMRILLGPMELTHPKAKEGYSSMWVNLGDCPISVKYFVEWLAAKMLSRDQVNYPLTKFVNDLVNDLVKNFLNNDSCFGYSVKQKTRLNQATISSFGAGRYDPITTDIITRATNQAAASDGIISMRTYLGNYTPEQMPILNPSGPSDSARTSIPIENEYNFFVYFAGRTMPVELMKGDKASDEARGIFHYMLGRDRGLVKNIKLTKTQTKGLAEVRFEQDGYDGLKQLRVVYDAQVDMFASVNTFPGTYIYIDPRGFAPEGSGDDEFRMTDLGIGGYYMIVRSEHEFAEGKANSTLHTKWVNQIDKDADADSETQSVSSTAGTGDPMSRKCSIQLRKEEPPEMSSPGIFGSLFG